MEPPVKDDRPINEMIQAAQVRLIGAEGEQIGVVNIDAHDYDVKMRAMNKFLGEGDKVKVTMRFRGREMAHQDLGLKVLHRVRDDLEELTKIEQFPKMEGRQMVMVLAPK